MKFIDDGFFPRAAKPGVILPIESMRIDHFAGTVHVLRLKARSWVRNFLCTVDSVAI